MLRQTLKKCLSSKGQTDCLASSGLEFYAYVSSDWAVIDAGLADVDINADGAPCPPGIIAAPLFAWLVRSFRISCHFRRLSGHFLRIALHRFVLAICSCSIFSVKPMVSSPRWKWPAGLDLAWLLMWSAGAVRYACVGRQNAYWHLGPWSAVIKYRLAVR